MYKQSTLRTKEKQRHPAARCNTAQGIFHIKLKKWWYERKIFVVKYCTDIDILVLWKWFFKVYFKIYSVKIISIILENVNTQVIWTFCIKNTFFPPLTVALHWLSLKNMGLVPVFHINDFVATPTPDVRLLFRTLRVASRSAICQALPARINRLLFHSPTALRRQKSDISIFSYTCNSSEGVKSAWSSWTDFWASRVCLPGFTGRLKPEETHILVCSLTARHSTSCYIVLVFGDVSSTLSLYTLTRLVCAFQKTSGLRFLSSSAISIRVWLAYFAVGELATC